MTIPMRASPLLAGLCLAACTVHHTPREFELEEPWPTLKLTAPLAVRAGDAPSGRRVIELAGPNFTLDLGEYTRALVERVEEGLTSQGAAVDSSAGKSLELEVVYANILPGAGNMHCVVDFTVRAGNGYVRGHQTRAKSINAEKACNAALSRAALACLGDPRLRAYLSGG